MSVSDPLVGMDLRVVVRSLLATVREKHLTFLAASIAFYAFLSIIPLLVLILVTGTVVGEEAFATTVVTLVEDVLSPTATDTLEETLQQQSGRRIGVLGSLGLLWSSLSVFRGLNIAFAKIYDQRESISLLTQLRNGIITAISIGSVITAMAITSIFVRLPSISRWSILLVLLLVVFYLLYYFLPPVPVSPLNVLPGVVLATVSWLVLRGGFQLYVAFSGKSAVYGTLGAAFLLLIWFYAASSFLLLGAALNAVIAESTV